MAFFSGSLWKSAEDVDRHWILEFNFKKKFILMILGQNHSELEFLTKNDGNANL